MGRKGKEENQPDTSILFPQCHGCCGAHFMVFCAIPPPTKVSIAVSYHKSLHLVYVR